MKWNSKKYNACGCGVCAGFRSSPAPWFPKDECAVCKRTDLPSVAWIPPLLKEFLGFETLCEWCRNGIRSYIIEWKLCWATSPEGALKWAMTDWLRTQYWQQQMDAALNSPRECDRAERRKGKPSGTPGRDKSLCGDCWSYFKGHGNSKRCPKCKAVHNAHVAGFNQGVRDRLKRKKVR